MCGICGIVALGDARVDVRTVQLMTDLLWHRGPDDGDVFAWGEKGNSPPIVSIGHRRLSILDLSSRARQPMSYDGATIVYNGEVYNFVELKGQLETLGHRFQTRSDTEVILHAYRQWGTSCVERFNGVFSFALWDERERLMFAARDRLGVKPFYFLADKDRFIFASEIRSILSAVPSARVANDSLVYDFLVNGRLDHTDETFFRGIVRLPAGAALIVKEGRIRIDRYWIPRASCDRFGRSFADNACEFRELLGDAVRLQMRSDVPVGCCLSGGLDSSAIAGLAASHCTEPLQVFTARYEHRSMDEWRYARYVHEMHRVAPIPVYAKADAFLETIRDVVSTQEEPFASPAVFAQWTLMRAIHNAGIRVVLDGQGGDEILCGYAKYTFFNLRDLLRCSRYASFVKNGLAALGSVGPQHFDLGAAQRYLPKSLWVDRRRHALLQPGFSEAWKDRGVAHPSMMVPDQQILDLTRFSVPVLLRYEDKNAMAHSVESRVPFLDHRLVEFALSVPVEHKIQGGQSKLLMREALKGVLPEPIRRRRSKLGFGGHWGLWMKDLRPGLGAWLDGAELRTERYVRRDALRSLWSDFDPAFFRAFVLEEWMQTFDVS